MSIDKSNIIRGNKALAEILHVHVNTIVNWRKRGVLKRAMIIDCGRVLVYDLSMVRECLRIQPGTRR